MSVTGTLTRKLTKPTKKMVETLIEKANQLRKEGLSGDKLKQKLQEVVPSATEKDINNALDVNFTLPKQAGGELVPFSTRALVTKPSPQPAPPPPPTSTELVPTGRGTTTMIAGKEGISEGRVVPGGRIEQSREVTESIRPKRTLAEALSQQETPPMSTALVPTDQRSTTMIAGKEGISAGRSIPEGRIEQPREVTERIRPGAVSSTKVPEAPKTEAEAPSFKEGDTVTWDNKKQVVIGTGVAAGGVGFYTLRDPDTGKVEVVRAENLKDETPTETVKTETEGLGGVVPAGAPAPQPQQQPTEEVKQSQQELPSELGAMLNQFRTIREQVGVRPISMSEVQDGYEALTKVEENIAKQYQNNPPPQLKDITAARREAFQAYKDRARRNDILAALEKAVNAIGQFASAQAAQGTTRVGLFQPSYTDYDKKTQQALDEYRMELGLLGEERRESEQEVARYERGKEEARQRLRQSIQDKIAAAKGNVQAQERVQEEAKDTANYLLSQIVSQSKADQAAAGENKKVQASLLEEEKKRLQSALQAANALSVTDKYEKPLTDLATSLGATTVEMLTGQVGGETITEREGRSFTNPFPDSDKSFAKETLAPAVAAKVSSRLSDIEKQLQALRGGGTVQQAAPGGAPAQRTVTVAEVEAALANYPGVSRDEYIKKLQSKNITVIGK